MTRNSVVTWHASWFRRMGEALIVLVPLALGIYLVVSKSPLGFIVGGLPVCALVSGYGIWVISGTVVRITLSGDEATIEVPFRKPWKVKSFEFWVHCDRGQIRGEGREVWVWLGAFRDRGALQSALEAASSEANIAAVRTAIGQHRRFETDSFRRSAQFLFGGIFGYLLLVAGFTNPANLPELGILALLLTVLLLAMNQPKGYIATVSPAGLRVISRRGEKILAWEEIDWVIAETTGGKPKQDITRIEWHGEWLVLNCVFDDFPLLQAIVSTQVEAVRPGHVLDKRPYAQSAVSLPA